MTAKPPLTVLIAGWRHYDRGLLWELPPGTPLRLVREPDNKHDALAVQVWVNDRMVGFPAARRQRRGSLGARRRSRGTGGVRRLAA